ncbi:MAG TPA: dienelactone hydrolase family protein [Actinospica sp.]|jgi:carboxymethylenebutenolidase|nr:dienelactone hydrolase family protein [Actinospica sp.]
MSDAFLSQTITIGTEDGEIEAYAALAQDVAPRGGVVVIHHMPGYDEPSKEITRRFAALGYNAVMPNLYWRDAPGAAPDDAAAAGRAKGGVPDERLTVDVQGAADFLRSLPNSNGKVGTIGYCSGGRQSVVAAITVDVDAAVDCYGAYVTGTVPDGWPLKITALNERVAEARCPILGLFGKDDKYPTQEQVADFEKFLTDAGKDFEFHSYEDAGHAFFAVDRPSFRPEAAKDGWARIATFYGKHLGA